MDILTFHATYSEEMFYAFMSNNTLSSSTKKEMARRILSITGNVDKYDEAKVNSKHGKVRQARINVPQVRTFTKIDIGNIEDLKLIRTYCSLYLKNDIVSKVEFAVIKPYFVIREYLLGVRDYFKSLKVLIQSKLSLSQNKSTKPQSAYINWNEERASAVSYGECVANDNPFGIDNDFYDRNIAAKFKLFKGTYKGLSYSHSSEYTDLKLLFDICKDEGIKPLIISVPVNGWWYDYCGFSKEDRQFYYKRVRDMAKSYGFEFADFSNHEYDKYFLKDDQHIGYKGWVDVNESLVKYYNGYKQQNKREFPA
jgi:D-alanine transfer protein